MYIQLIRDGIKDHIVFYELKYYNHVLINHHAYCCTWNLKILSTNYHWIFVITGCKYNGQFLPNDYDECSYFRCDFGDEPWYDEYGNIKFVEVPMKCAGGSSTNHYKFDPQNPCGETSDKCGAPGKMLYKWHHDIIAVPCLKTSIYQKRQYCL